VVRDMKSIMNFTFLPGYLLPCKTLFDVSCLFHR